LTLPYPETRAAYGKPPTSKTPGAAYLTIRQLTKLNPRLKEKQMSVQVFDVRSEKWVLMDGTDVGYTEDQKNATIFSLSDLVSVLRFPDFVVYARDFRAVPMSHNAPPVHECMSVTAYIEDMKDVSDYSTHGF
jgi:hypothetical protein